MKKSHLIAISILLAITLAQVALFLAGATSNAQPLQAEQKQIKVFVNGKETAIKPEMQNKKHLVSLHIPADQRERTWEIKVKYDKEKSRIDVEKTVKRVELRGKVRCNICNGTGECQECYPIGSGKGTNSRRCGYCEGTGKCNYCHGEGEY